MRHIYSYQTHFCNIVSVSHMSKCITCEWFTHMSKHVICKWFMSHTNMSREIGTSRITHSDQMSHVCDVSHFGHMYIRHIQNTVTFWSYFGHNYGHILVTFIVTFWSHLQSHFGHIYGHILVRGWFMSQTNS